MTSLNYQEQTAYDLLRARGVASPTYEQMYEVIQHELHGPSLQEVRERAYAAAVALHSARVPESRNQRRARRAHQRRLAKKARKAVRP